MLWGVTYLDYNKPLLDFYVSCMDSESKPKNAPLAVQLAKGA